MPPQTNMNRSNDEWLADLNSKGPEQARAVEALRSRLERGLHFYLSQERSDLSSRSEDDLKHLAQDFAQDAILKILDKLDTFRGESQFLTWASKIAVRVAISELRRTRYKNYSLEHLTVEGEVMPDITSLAISPDEGPNPERYTEQQDVAAIINQAIHETLTDRQRTALLAYVIDGVPMEVIADRMDTNRNALYKLLHDARLKLKHYMESQGLSLDYILDLF
jgi:RNA polymerase sigma-70 factor (ECF subfamily)